MTAPAPLASWPAGLAGWCIQGQYRRSPFPGSYAPTELECVPMTRAREYAQGALMEVRGQGPVLLSPSQRYRVLAAFVRGLREHVPGLHCVLVRLYGPDFNVALPADLLAADVLLVHEPLAALPPVLAAGRGTVAVIHHDLRVDGAEQGTNRVSIAVLQADAGARERLAAWLGACPMLQALEGLQLRPLAASMEAA